jgi:hypothetical protein
MMSSAEHTFPTIASCTEQEAKPMIKASTAIAFPLELETALKRDEQEPFRDLVPGPHDRIR